MEDIPRAADADMPPIDTEHPNIARVYDAVLNGKDNFAVDRAVRDQLLEVRPEALVLAKDNRAWLIRVVRYLAHTVGIDQFIDCGSGLPTAENTHQIAQRINPNARVAYIDNDPAVLAHGRALLAANENTRFLPADVRDPWSLLADPELLGFLDFTRPIGLLQVGVLHHLLDEDGPSEVVSTCTDALSAGSYLAVSHFYNPNDDSAATEAAEQAEEILLGGGLGSGRFRSAEEIEQFFHGLDMVPPGVVTLADWRPDEPRLEPLAIPQRLMLGGLGRKP